MKKLQRLDDVTVAVTGADGFIGSFVVRRLREAGVRLKVLIEESRARASSPSGTQVYVGDVINLESLRPFVADAQIVVHFAGPPSVADSFNAPAAYAATHVCGSANLLEASVAAGVRRIVYASSADVYGIPASNPVSEGHRLAARSPYAACKMAVEAYIEAFSRAYGIDGIMLRFFSVYGPGQRATSVLGSIVRQAGESDAIRLHDLRPVRDYCYVGDVAEAVLAACTTRALGTGPVNIGTGIGTSVEALAKTVLAVVRRDVPIVAIDSVDRPRAADLRELIADTRKASSELHWTAAVSLEDGIHRLLAEPVPT